MAIRIIREFTTRHMKASEVKIDKEVNLQLWTRGIGNPPRRIKLEMERDEDGVVRSDYHPPKSHPKWVFI